MIYVFHTCLSLVLIVFQTAILPTIPGFRVFYDLLTIHVFYLGLFRPMRESLPVLFVLGFAMDNLSGAPFGLYTTTYFWLFVGVKWITRFLNVRNLILLPILIGISALIQNLIFLGTMTSAGNLPRFHFDLIKIGGMQILWAVTTGPMLLLMFDAMQRQWNRMLLKMRSGRESQSE
jgi:rod shape-determining protein MreD